MATFDWDKWNLGWLVGLPKNEMWAKVRSGGNDATGNPTFRYPKTPDKSSVDPTVVDVIAAHRFVSPAIDPSPGNEHCFCGWSGGSYASHLAEKVANLLPKANIAVPATKKAPVKRASKKADE